jgi:hypothetical protein
MTAMLRVRPGTRKPQLGVRVQSERVGTQQTPERSAVECLQNLWELPPNCARGVGDRNTLFCGDAAELKPGPSRKSDGQGLAKKVGH